MNITKITQIFKDILEHDQFVSTHKPSNLKAKIALQAVVAFSFLILSIANVVTQSYYMLILTMLGFSINTIFALISFKLQRSRLSSCSCILTCSFLFAYFVINGGNDGFACLWVILLPLLSMVIMDFKFGLCASIFFQIFLVIVFWTPLNAKLLYEYNDQFCLRFPLFYFVTFMLGLLLTVSLRQAEYNEFKHSIELEEMIKKTLWLSRIDPLTKLANRRYSYEELNNNFAERDVQHCIVMGDIDNFKQINDLYGHEFGDEVLIIISKYINDVLPSNYLKSRWGGEEFLFAANHSLDEVFEQVEKLRKAISQHPFLFDSIAINITMTFGIAQYTDIQSLTDTINLADKHLYVGKNKNKNCTVTSDEPMS